MPNPTHSDLHIQQALTDISVAYAQDRDNFGAARMFPVIGVQKQADKFFTYSREDWLRSDAQPRAPGAEAEVSGYRLSTDNYFCERYALAHDISDPERANADPAVQNLDMDATEYLTEQILLRNEKDFVSNFFTTGVWDGASSSTDMTGSSTSPSSTASNFLQWNDVASTPIEDIRGEYTNVASLTGRRPNTLGLGAQTWTALADHPDILDRIKYTERGVVTTDLLASLLDLDDVVNLWAIENTNAEGSSSGSYSFVAGKNALLAYVERSPGLRRPSAGYTFVWTGMQGAPALGARIKRYRIEPNESDRVEAEQWRDFKVVGSNLGAFFASAVA